MRRLPLSSMIEEVVEAHRGGGIALEVNGCRTGQASRWERAMPEFCSAWANLVENAIDYARQIVTIHVEHDRDKVVLTIEDDGPGYSPDILARIGEAYVTSRSRGDSAGGLGLGLFIAKTLLERSGAALHFDNGSADKPGARVRISWPRAVMETASIK